MSRESTDVFAQPIRFLKRVGSVRAEALEAAGMTTCYDLLQYFPRRHLDRSNTSLINEALGSSSPVTIIGVVRACGVTGFKKSKRFEAIVEDERGDRVSCVWFQRTKWIASVFNPGDRVALHGRVRLYRRSPSMSHPDFDKLDTSGPSLETGRIVSLYHGSATFDRVGLSSRVFRRIIFDLIKERGLGFPEVLPQWILDEHGLIDGRVALRAIHFPKNRDELAEARRRLVFEELFFIQLLMARTRQSRSVEPAARFDPPGFQTTRFLGNLPFDLTAGQRRVLAEIAHDTQTGVQMNRLLQGDVGSGKTIVAVAAMLQAVDSGFQAAFLAPTEILAEQHYANLRDYFDFLDVSMRLLTGGQKAAHRREVLHDIASGGARIVVGTHALIQEGVVFNRLGVAVVDEQHRFGVMQRANLFRKGENPHILMMTATPIPRSLAMTLYGDLDVSIMREMPANRKPVVTEIYREKRREEAYKKLEGELRNGRQAYVVYPLVSESEKLDLKDAMTGLDTIRDRFPDYRVELVHGRMSSAEKDDAMSRFKAGTVHILVATTVIEVGVDVANASVMIIEHAERFGLSQLHQLRGRVGRGAEQSYCFLMASHKQTEEGRLRLEAMEQTTDGFRIAEADLRLRGAGDFFGTRQSGLAELRIADLVADVDILAQAREAAQKLVRMDPDLADPHHAVLSEFFERFYAERYLGFAKVG